MNPRRCENCIWWDRDHSRLAAAPQIAGINVAGLCRKHKPGAEKIGSGYYLGVQPIMDAADYCGEFREDAR